MPLLRPSGLAHRQEMLGVRQILRRVHPDSRERELHGHRLHPVHTVDQNANRVGELVLVLSVVASHLTQHLKQQRGFEAEHTDVDLLDR